MATVQDWIESTRSLLMSGQQGERNSLATPYTPGDPTLTLTGSLGGIVPGVRLAIGTNTFYVRSVSQAGLSATVFGAQEGTTDAAAAAGALVWVGPRFTDAEILGALLSELSDLSGPGNGLFAMASVDVTYANGIIGYDLTGVTDLIDVYELRAQASGTGRDWPAVPKQQWRLDRASNTTVFPSGLALSIFAPAWAGLIVRVVYRRGFTAPTTTATDLTTTGLPATAWDIPPLGAALRLVAPREIKRNFTEAQGDTRRSSEVSAGSVQGSYRGIAALRAARIQSEAERLMARWPDKRW
jgi:hypothetical protein